MSTIKGIFEPFAPYVTKQLELRKNIISKRTTPKKPSNNNNEFISSETQPENNTLGIDGDLETTNITEYTPFQLNDLNFFTISEVFAGILISKLGFKL